MRKNLTSLFIKWVLESNIEAARALSKSCLCGADETYKKAKPKVDTTYMHSLYCPKFKKKVIEDEAN